MKKKVIIKEPEFDGVTASGENYIVKFTEEGFYIEISDDKITDEEIFGGFSTRKKVIDYKDITVKINAIRRLRESKAIFVAIVVIKSGDEAFDGEVEFSVNEKILDTAKLYGFKLLNGELFTKIPPKKEKSEKVFKEYRRSAINYILCFTLPTALLAISLIFANEKTWWTVFVSAMIFTFTFITALISILSPRTIKFYSDYVEFIDRTPVAFIDNCTVEAIERLKINEKEYVILFTATAYLETAYSDKLYEYVKQKFPQAEIIERT